MSLLKTLSVPVFVNLHAPEEIFLKFLYLMYSLSLKKYVTFPSLLSSSKIKTYSEINLIVSFLFKLFLLKSFKDEPIFFSKLLIFLFNSLIGSTVSAEEKFSKIPMKINILKNIFI